MSRIRITKRNRSLLIGIACGLCCALCVGAYTFQIDQRADAAQAELLSKYGGDRVEVCVAKHDIPAGQTIAEGDIEVRTWIATLLPQDAVIEKKEAIGHQVGSTILAGEVVSAARFGTTAADIEVPDGYSAISVPTDDVQAVGGALKPGMRVDVYATGSSSTSRIAASVLVIATSAASDDSSAKGSWLTLAVRPTRVEELVSAAQNLSLYFVLPAANGDVAEGEAGADASDVLGANAAERIMGANEASNASNRSTAASPSEEDSGSSAAASSGAWRREEPRDGGE